MSTVHQPKSIQGEVNRSFQLFWWCFKSMKTLEKTTYRYAKRYIKSVHCSTTGNSTRW